MNKDLIAIFEYMEREKGIKREVLIEAIEESLCLAARKTFLGANDIIVHIDPKTGIIDASCQKEIVETVTIPNEEISLEDLEKLELKGDLGEEVRVPLDPKALGRIAAQKAKQIISQKLKNAERDVVCEEYRHRVGEIISGTVKKISRGDITVDLGKVDSLMPAKNYPRLENYREGEKILALLQEVIDVPGVSAEVILSRSDKEFVRQLFIQEVPELRDGIISIKKIVREPGYRTKLTVESTDHKIDPVGACIGVRGTRIKNIIRELHNEKIDVFAHADDPILLLQNALSPIEIKKLGFDEDKNAISIIVNDDDFAAAIGKKGMNVRLNAELIGQELEVRRLSEYKKVIELEKLEIAESEDPWFDNALQLDEVNPLVVENLIEAGFDTFRKLLAATPEELTNIPGVNTEMVDNFLEQIRKQRG